MTDQIEAAAAITLRDYFVMAFLVSLGALQIAVSISELRGIWLIPHRVATRILGMLLIVAGIAFYVLAPLWLAGPWGAGTVIDSTSEGRAWATASIGELSAARNINDIHGGMAGTAYAVYFLASAVLAFVFAAGIGELNMRLLRSFAMESQSGSSRNAEMGPEDDGIARLKRAGIVTTVTESLRNMRRNGAEDAKYLMRDRGNWSVSRFIERALRD